MVLRHRARWALAAALTITGFGACADEPVSQEQPTTERRFGDVEVVLTEPHCDVCETDDKSFLVARSPIVFKVVQLIDGARETLDLAQYTFSNRDIKDAIQRAHDRGVRVRVAIDDAQDKPGTRATELKDAGVPVRFISGSQGGLMHAKFLVVDGSTALTGSNNFSSTGVSINEENTMIIRGAQDLRVSGLACHFGAIWEDDAQAAGACSNDQAAFSPSAQGRNLVRDQLRSATKSIDVLMHHLTLDDLMDELIEAARDRGVAVRLVVNLADMQEHTGGDFARLIEAGGKIRFKRNNDAAYQLLHHKLAIVDGHTLVNGSGNWSSGGFFRNYENYMLYREPHVLAKMRATYHRLFTWALDADSLAEGRSAAEQHRLGTRHFFGNLHAHFSAHEGDDALDDGDPIVLDANGADQAVDIPAELGDAAEFAYDYAKQRGGLDFLALTPHCREDAAGDTEANMSRAGFEKLRAAAEKATSDEFYALAGMEWSSNSTGNHVGILGSSELSKVERGRYDELYGEFLVEHARAGERVFVMLNHPRTFQNHEDVLDGGWDMVFGHNLLDIPKASERKQKFNDYGLDDFAPMVDVRQSWLDGAVMPDADTVDETWKTILYTAGDHIRLMEVTLNRGNEFGAEEPQNPSVVPSEDDPEVLDRRTKVHTDYDYFLTRGFRVAPVASHDNHYANWGTGHTARTVVIGDAMRERAFLDAVEFRHVYASEDENLAVQLYAEDRDPMGSIHRTASDSVRATLWLDDPDYAGTYSVRVFQGKVGEDGVTLRQELPELGAGSHTLTFSVPGAAMHFVYLEIFQTETNRMAWTSPIWIDHMSTSYVEDAYPHGSGRLLEGSDVEPGEGGAGGGTGGAGGGETGGVDPAGSIVINEVDYDQAGSDTTEFIELFNTGSEPIALENLVLVGVNGATLLEYLRVDLSQAGITLEPGQYLVVGTTTALASVPSAELTISLPKASDNLQNGASDALGIVDLASGALLDAISYEGALTDGEITGLGPFSFVEGTALAISDTGGSSLSRSPNGSDTNDAAADWVSATPSPGQSN